MWSRGEIEEWLRVTQVDLYQYIPLPGGLAIEGKYDRRPSFHAVFPDVSVLNGQSYLDVGCAQGAMVFEAERHGATRIVGVDTRGGCISVARDIAQMSDSRAEFHVIDLSLPAGLPQMSAFATVTCFNVIHRVRRPFLFLERMLALADRRFAIEYVTPGYKQANSIGVTLAPGTPGILLSPTALEVVVYNMDPSMKLVFTAQSPRGVNRRVTVFERK